MSARANFDDGYLFGAIGVLVECDPSKTPDLLSSFQSRLDKLRQSTNPDRVEWDAFCKGANDLIEKIHHLNPTVNPNAIRQIIFSTS